MHVEVDTSKFHLPDLPLEALRQRALAGALLAGEAVRGMIIDRCTNLGIDNSDGYISAWQASGALRVTRNEVEGGRIEIEVMLTNEHPRAKIVEDGASAYRLPEVIHWGSTPRTKWTKDGTPYLQVPLRHSTPGATGPSVSRMMPAEIFQQAKTLNYTMRNNAGGNPTKGEVYGIWGQKGQGGVQYLQADTYRYGGRLKGVGGRYEGLMKTGTARHSVYLTIRTITPNSPGWNIPAKAGKHVARDVMSVAGEEIEPIVLEALMGGLLG